MQRPMEPEKLTRRRNDRQTDTARECLGLGSQGERFWGTGYFQILILGEMSSKILPQDLGTDFQGTLERPYMPSSGGRTSRWAGRLRAMDPSSHQNHVIEEYLMFWGMFTMCC